MFKAKKLIDGNIEIVCEGYYKEPDFTYVLDCNILKQAVLSCIHDQLPEVGIFFGDDTVYKKASPIVSINTESLDVVYMCLLSMGHSRTIMVFNTHSAPNLSPTVRHSYIFGTDDVDLVKDLIFEEE
jgi:hypothetical protein